MDLHLLSSNLSDKLNFLQTITYFRQNKRREMKILGIDVGGSGIKAAIVDTKKGTLISERKRFDTPQPSTPANITKTVKALVDTFNYKGVIGVSFPTVVVKNRALTSGNIDESWVGVKISKLFEKQTGHKYVVRNDADAAGLAEMTMGAGKGTNKGTVIMVTIGTGLGTGVFSNGELVPNIELGRIFGKDGHPIEFYAGDRARKLDELSWTEWGKRFNFFLKYIHRVFTPKLFILGGGASKKWDKYKDQITVETPIKIAHFLNNAGIIGAAMAAESKAKKK